MRKLRKTDEESSINGKEYTKRLKSFYNERLKHSSFYSWAYKGNDEQALNDQEEDALFE